MKNNCLLKPILFTFLGLISIAATAQTVATFENITLTPASYWVGSSPNDEFVDGEATFPSKWDTAWSYWSDGWAVSNLTDSTTAGYTNMYSATTAIGVNGSSNYTIGKHNSIIHLTGTSTSAPLNGMFLTNTTYAAISMRDGDFFAKKFGGSTGNDPDYFVATIWGYTGGFPTADSVNFYLADYRDSDNSQDYIITDWTWVDLSPLGIVDSVLFTLDGSDVGTWGLNTPAFYAMDNFNDSTTLLANPTISHPECGLSNGSISMAASGGLTPYAYIWQGGSTSNESTGLAPGTYYITLSDANASTRDLAIVISDLQIVADVTTSDVTCNGLSDGSVSIAVSGASGPFTYTWSNTSTGWATTGLLAGTYNYTVTTPLGCSNTGSGTVTEQSAISITTSSGVGTVDAVATGGGSTVYLYNWDNNASGANIEGLVIGTYLVTVSNSYGCSTMASASVTVESTMAPFEVNINLTADSYWIGATATDKYVDGSMTFPSVWDDTWSYWSEGWAVSNMTDSSTAGVTNMYSATTAIGLNGSPNYSIGKSNSTIRLTGTIASQPLNGTYITNTTYAAIAMRDGDAFAKQFGGTTGDDPDYFAVTIWGYAGGVKTTDSVNFYLADYRDSDNTLDYIIKDWTWVDLSLLGTVDSLIFILDGSDVGAWGLNTPAFFAMDNFNDSITVVASPAISHSSCGNSNGSVNITASGGVTPYTYAWQNGNSTSNETGLSPGTYNISVTDGNSMTRVLSIVIENIEIIDVITSVDISCNGLTDGSVSVAASGASSPYSFVWNNSATTSSLSGLSAGVYNYTVSNSLGCASTGAANISNPSAITITSTVDTGAVAVTVTGGGTGYYYAWENGQTTANVTGLAIGTYTLTVTDSNGCVVIDSATVSTTGIINLVTETIEFSLYPNPVTNKLVVEGLPPGASLEIKDIQGRLIKAKWILSGREIIPVSDLESGVYILIASHGNAIKVYRFIKQ